MIIVLSGEAGAGKDSIANILVERHGFTMFSLAGPLKRFAADMMGFSKEQLYGPSHSRNAADPRWDLKCPACLGTGTTKVHYPEPVNDYSIGLCKRCEGKGKIEISPRSFLQPLGTEFMRDLVHPDVLSIRASWDLQPLAEQHIDIVINDARFQNDRDNIHAWFAAKRVDVRAPGKKHSSIAAWRQHASEQDRPTDEHVEYVFENPEEYPFPTLPERVEEMLRELRSCQAGH